MAPRIIGRQPSPRALIVGFDEQTQRRLIELFPTARVVDGLGHVQQAEWDLLITDQEVITDAIPELFVLAIGTRNCGDYKHQLDVGGVLQGARTAIAAAGTSRWSCRCPITSRRTSRVLFSQI